MSGRHYSPRPPTFVTPATYQRLSCADASYVDPLGPQAERPKTGAKKRLEEDEFADEELGDDLLPE